MTKAKAAQGRPAFTATYEQRRLFAALVARGQQQEVICTFVKEGATGKPITVCTLAKRFLAELARQDHGIGTAYTDFARAHTPKAPLFRPCSPKPFRTLFVLSQ